MNRAEIKHLAKEKIRGNKWNLLWPLLVISVISSILTSFVGPKYNFDLTNVENMETFEIVKITPLESCLTFVIGILIAVITAGYLKYVLNFVRTGKFNTDDILNTVKAKWLDLLIANILVGIIVAVGSILFVIPGIIAALALAMVDFIIIDKDVKGADSLKASNELMKGHKWEFFVFMLSFIGWYILVPFTLGILLIWLVPYVQVATVLYYDNLKPKKD